MRISDARIFAVDVETTGLDTWNERVLEVGVGRVVGTRLEQVVSTVVRTDVPIPEEATAINGIKLSSTLGAPWLAAVLESEFAATPDAWMAHHATFDREMLLHDGLRQGVSRAVLRRLQSAPWIDTRLLARALDDAPAGAHGYSLGDLAKRLGIVVGERHRAEVDVRLMVEVWHRMAPHLPSTLEGVLQVQAAYVAKGRGSR